MSFVDPVFTRRILKTNVTNKMTSFARSCFIRIASSVSVFSRVSLTYDVLFQHKKTLRQGVHAKSDLFEDSFNSFGFLSTIFLPIYFRRKI